ncbi:MAG: hypothetical protein KAS12_00145 [Candidatus Aenigmarchaeota archaeon]|nr:hypothetical protein [Candidatus Aenigmarchaeota archaeon]
MKLKILIILLILASISLPDVNASTCDVKFGACSIGEQCVFSMYSENNAHASKCGGAYTWNVCCTTDAEDFITADCSVRDTACNAGEGEIISLYNTTNAHAQLPAINTYNQSVCCTTPTLWDSYDCHFNTSTTCDSDETAIISMYNYTNSHIGNISTYDNILCCKKADNTKPITTVYYPSIVPSSSITFDITCTDTGGSGGCDTTNISVYESITGDYYNSCESIGFDANGNSSCIMTLPTCDYSNYNISVASTDKYGNINYTANYGTFQVKLDDGCDCLSNPLWCASSCVSGICSSSGDTTFVAFDLKTPSINVVIGQTKTIHLSLQNPSYVPQTVPLYLGSFDIIKNWVWFDGHKYDDKRRNMTVILGPKESQTVIIKVLGGKYGQYNLAIGPNDISDNKYDELQINIISDDNDTNIFSSTPGLGIISLIFIMLFGGFLRLSRIDSNKN